MLKRMNPIEAPIIGCEISQEIDVLILESNYTQDKIYNDLEKAKETYKNCTDEQVICIGIEDSEEEVGCCMGLSIAEAEELVTALTSMIKIIKGEC